MIDRSIDVITDTIFGYYGGDQKENLSCRKSEYQEPRHVVAYLIRKHIKIGHNKVSYAYIGEKLGKKDHATIINSCKKVSGWIETNSMFRSKLAYLEHFVLRRLLEKGLISTPDSDTFLNNLIKEREEIEVIINEIIKERVVAFKNVS